MISPLYTGGLTWGYQPNAPIKSLDQVIHLLVGAVGRDGNLLLNVGPRPDGQIDPAQAARLREVGAWLKLYGESIYNTRGGPFLPGDFGVSTYRDNTIYLHILHPTTATLALPRLPANVTGCKVLTGGSATCTQTVAGVDVTLSQAADPASPDTIVALSLDSPASGISPIATHITPPKLKE